MPLLASSSTGVSLLVVDSHGVKKGLDRRRDLAMRSLEDLVLERLGFSGCNPDNLFGMTLPAGCVSSSTPHNTKPRPARS